MNELQPTKERTGSPMVSVVITYLDYCLTYLEKCVMSVARQTYHEIEIVIVDRTSRSVVRDLCRKILPADIPFTVIAENKKAGFAENYNSGILSSTGAFVLVLNPDTILDHDCVRSLILSMDIDHTIGCTSPKLLRMNEQGEVQEPPIIDSAGMVLTKYLRHYDRGAGEPDVGQYDKTAFVFGVTGAAAFFRKSCLEDIRINGQYFDEDFEFGREDADISWRLNNLGWKCLYFPKSIVYHLRTARPGGRSLVSEYTNMHSVKNRYLLMLNNLSLSSYLKYAVFILSRDFLVLSYVLLREHSSLPGLMFILRNRERLLKKRSILRTKWRLDSASTWFCKPESPI